MSDTDEAAPDPDQTLASTQPPSQPSQSEQNNPPLPEKHWGCLIPISDYTSISASSVPRETIYFKLERPTETVGRSVDNCSIPLTHHANDISRLHARIHWDGVRGRSSLCTIIHLSDASTTFLNRAPLNKGQVYCLAHGDMVAFGGSSQERAYHRFSFAFLAKDNQSAPFEIDYDFNASTNKVGEGGYAEVYKGVHRNTGDFVAIKMIRKPDVPLQPSDLTNPHSPIEKLIQLTRKEVRAMRRLNHLNVTKLLAEYWEESLLQTRFIGYLVLEYVDGNTLLRYINDNGNGGLTEAQTMALMWQMLNGTAYLHSRRIIHRDLKPENILLTSDPNPVVKLADFGLARILSSSELNVHTPCGSPDYVAPEVLREGDPGSKKPTYDAKADAFSIGIILYVMLFAKLPYTSYGSAGKANLAQLVQRRTIEWSSFADRGSSDDVRSLFKVMVRKDPQGRLSVHEALDHRWFAGYSPPEHHISPPDDTNLEFSSQVSTLSLEDDDLYHVSGNSESSSQATSSSQASGPMPMPGAYDFSQDTVSLYGSRGKQKAKSVPKKSQSGGSQSQDEHSSDPVPQQQGKGKTPLKRTISVVEQNTTDFLYGVQLASATEASPSPESENDAAPPPRPVKMAKTNHEPTV